MAKTKRASQKHVLNLVKIRQDCSLDQTRHELIFFSFAESLGLSFLHLYCLSPKYLALASQHFLPALTEDGCFDFPLKCLIGVGKPSKARGLALDTHQKGRRLQGLAFLQAVNPRSPLPKDRKTERSCYPWLTEGEAEVGSPASAEVPLCWQRAQHSTNSSCHLFHGLLLSSKTPGRHTLQPW